MRTPCIRTARTPRPPIRRGCALGQSELLRTDRPSSSVGTFHAGLPGGGSGARRRVGTIALTPASPRRLLELEQPDRQTPITHSLRAHRTLADRQRQQVLLGEPVGPRRLADDLLDRERDRQGPDGRVGWRVVGGLGGSVEAQDGRDGQRHRYLCLRWRGCHRATERPDGRQGEDGHSQEARERVGPA